MSDDEKYYGEAFIKEWGRRGTGWLVRKSHLDTEADKGEGVSHKDNWQSSQAMTFAIFLRTNGEIGAVWQLFYEYSKQNECLFSQSAN